MADGVAQEEGKVWWDEFNSEFWILVSGSILGFFGLTLQAILKSRCKMCSCLGFKCIREPAPVGKEPHLDISILDKHTNRNHTEIEIETPKSNV